MANPQHPLPLPIGIVVDAQQHRKGEGNLPPYAAPYLAEMVRHAGVSFDKLSPADLRGNLASRKLLLLAQDLELTTEEKNGLADFVQKGGVLIGIGGTSGMDALFGCQTGGFLQAGFLQVPGQPHAITGGLKRETHVFGGSHVAATAGKVLAQEELPAPEPGSAPTRVDAIIEHQVGHGYTLLFAFDLVASVLHIQQGKPVVPKPPREWAGTPQGCILDPDRDRDTVEMTHVDNEYYSQPPQRHPDGRPIYIHRLYLEPMADVLRELLLRAIFHSFNRLGAPLPILWYWPRGLTAIAHMSHDTDGNRQSLAWSLYYLLHSLNVPTTWCTMPVPGYNREFFNTLKETGYEIALHYATGNAPVRDDHRWSQKDFNWQFDQLCYMAQLTRITSNKNHGLGWQGRLEFYHWCQGKGIQIEQSRGDFGFTFGTCHPWRPMEDGQPGGMFLDVLALCFLTQDLTVVCPLDFMKPMVDRCYAAYGVSHFLFHPGHIEDPECERAIRETVAYTRSLGMEWWTSAAINTWERGRRQVAISPVDTSGQELHLSTATPLPQATLLFLVPDQKPGGPNLALDGRTLPTTIVQRYGHRFAQAISDLDGEHKIDAQGRFV